MLKDLRSSLFLLLDKAFAEVVFIKSLRFAVLLTIATFLPLGSVLADSGHDYKETISHSDNLHFAHPLISESPSPDTKIRLDYFFRDIDHKDENAKESELRLELEYAFHPTFSVELDVPYLFHDPDMGINESALNNVKLGFKFANFAFEEHNLLLGYGIEFGFPTGDEKKGIGSEHIFEIELFLDAGYKWESLEVVAFLDFGIPINQRAEEEVETEMGFNLSFLYHFHPRIQGILELGGETVLSGDENGESVVNIAPGIKFDPLPNRDFQLGLGLSFPLSDKEEFETQVLLSAFYHF